MPAGSQFQPRLPRAVIEAPAGVSDVASYLADAMAALPSEGGAIDLRAITGTKTVDADPFDGITKPVVLITGHATFEFTVRCYLPSKCVIIADGTTFKSSTGGGIGATSGILESRTISTTGGITAAGTSLTVASASEIDAGDLIAILGAAGGNSQQSSTVADGGDGITADQTSFAIASATGFSGTTYFLVDSEIIRGSISGTTVTVVERGALGTVAASHAEGATISAVGYHITEVESVAGTTVTLVDAATFSIADAPVLTGSSDLRIAGLATFDGNKLGSDPSHNLYGFYGILARGVVIEPTVTFKNCDHGGVALTASRECVVDGRFRDNGRRADGLGSEVWLFERCEGNRVLGSYRGGAYNAVFVDDRSSNFTLFSGACEDNVIEPTTVQGDYANAVVLAGSNYNTVRAGSIRGVVNGLKITNGQWATNPTPTGNVAYLGHVDASTYAVEISAGSNNLVVAPGGLASSKMSIAAGNPVLRVNTDGSLHLHNVSLRPQGSTGELGSGNLRWLAAYLATLDVRSDTNGAAVASVSNQAALGNTSARALFSAVAKDASGFFGAFPSDYATARHGDRVVIGANSDSTGVNVDVPSAGQDFRVYVEGVERVRFNATAGLMTDTIAELETDVGVTIDGLHIQDGRLPDIEGAVNGIAPLDASALVPSARGAGFLLSGRTRGISPNVDHSTTRYLCATAIEDPSATESFRQTLIPLACTVDAVVVKVSANNVDADTTITLRKNASATTLTVTVPANTTGTFTLAGDAVAFAAGDSIALEVVAGSGGMGDAIHVQQWGLQGRYTA